MKIVYGFLQLLNVFLIAFTLVSYIGPFVQADIFWLISVLALSYPWLLFFHILFIATWLLSSKPRWALASFFTLLLGWNYLTGFVNYNSQEIRMPGEGIAVMSFNVNELKYLENIPKSALTETKQDLKDHLQQFGQLDIICVQDMGQHNHKFFTDVMKMPYSHILGKQKVMTGIYSKFPIQDKGVIRFDNSFNSCVWADVKTPEGTVRIYSVHLQSNRITGDTDELLGSGSLNEEQTRKKIREMFAKYKRSTNTRSQQAAQVAAHLAECPHPVILCADLNDTPLSRAYRKMSRHLTDGFKSAGKGVATTYAGNIPGLRIDYIFADSNFTFNQHRILKDRIISDHYPVFATLSWTTD